MTASRGSCTSLPNERSKYSSPITSGPNRMYDRPPSPVALNMRLAASGASYSHVDRSHSQCSAPEPHETAASGPAMIVRPSGCRHCWVASSAADGSGEQAVAAIITRASSPRRTPTLSQQQLAQALVSSPGAARCTDRHVVDYWLLAIGRPACCYQALDLAVVHTDAALHLSRRATRQSLTVGVNTSAVRCN